MLMLTDRGMNVKPGKRDTWLTESAPKGHGRFCARVTKGGERLFYFRYTGPNGKREYLRIGQYDPDGENGSTLKEARAKAGEYSRLYQGGVTDIKGHLAAELRLKEAQRATDEARLEAERKATEREANRLTVEGLFDKWKAAQLSQRKDGGKEITRIFAKDIFPTLGHLPADAVKKGHVAGVVDAILGRGAPRLAKVCFSSLRQMFVYAVERDFIEADPTAGIRKKNIAGRDVERDRVLTDEEIKLLAGKLPAAGLLVTTRAAVWAVLATGCRIGELLNARWEHIDFVKRTWLIPEENAKNGVALEVHLSEFALKHFRTIQNVNHQTKWLFPSRAKKQKIGPVNSKTVTKQLTDRQREKALTGRSRDTGTLTLPGGKWSPHDLRRTASTMMGGLGIAPEVIERCLNHVEQNRIQRIYQRYSYRPEMKRAWEVLGERLEALTTSEKTADVLPMHKAARHQ
jgi:integrase